MSIKNQKLRSQLLNGLYALSPGLGFTGKSPARELPDGLDRNLAELNAFSFKAIIGLLIRQ